MKTARFWLVILLALLLPFRGAVAAAMLCPVAAVELQRADTPAPGHHHAQHAKDAATAGAQAGHPHDHGGSGAGKCNTCAAFCCVTPMPASDAVWVAPPAEASTRFPEPATPLPGFVTAGPERPPRAG